VGHSQRRFPNQFFSLNEEKQKKRREKENQVISGVRRKKGGRIGLFHLAKKTPSMTT